MATLQEVNNARAEYERLLKKFHDENTTTVRVSPAPDDYRGDLSCVAFLDAVEKKTVGGDGSPYRVQVSKNGAVVGELKEWYGNNGRGKLAASEFLPADGVTVINCD